MADVYLWKLQFGAICWRKMFTVLRMCKFSTISTL